MQARAHSLLKAKDGELREAREAAEAHFGDSLRTAEGALADVHRQLAQVPTSASLLVISQHRWCCVCSASLLCFIPLHPVRVCADAMSK